MNLNSFLKEITLFQDNIKEAPDIALEEIKRIIYQEQERRISLKDLPPMLPEEKELTKIEAIKAYRLRTNKGIREAMEAYKR